MNPSIHFRWPILRATHSRGGFEVISIDKHGDYIKPTALHTPHVGQMQIYAVIFEDGDAVRPVRAWDEDDAKLVALQIISEATGRVKTIDHVELLDSEAA